MKSMIVASSAVIEYADPDVVGNYRRVERLVRTGDPHTGIGLGKSRPSNPADPTIWHERLIDAGLAAACGEGSAGRCASARAASLPTRHLASNQNLMSCSGVGPDLRIKTKVRRPFP